MKNNLRRVTKISHKTNGKVEILSKNKLNTINTDIKIKIIEEYFYKHYSLGGIDIQSNKLKLFTDYRVIENQEKKLLLFREKILNELNRLYIELAKTRKINIKPKDKIIDITYDDEKLDNLINYLISLKKDEIFSRENELFLDENSLDLYSLLIQASIKRPIEQKFISFIVKCQEKDIDMKKEFKSLFIRPAVRNIKYSFFENGTHTRLLELKTEEEKNLKSNTFFKNYDEISTVILSKFEFGALYGDIKKIPDQNTYRDVFISNLREKIRIQYFKFYEKIVGIENISEEKKYICKIINDYIKRRTNKILKEYPQNDKIRVSDIRKYKNLFKENELKPKVKRAIINKLVYFIKYDYNETSEDKVYNKIKNSLVRKTRTYVNEIIYNLNVSNEAENEYFGANEFYKGFKEAINQNTLIKLNAMNEKSLFHSEEFLIPLYILRNYILHYEDGLMEVVEHAKEDDSVGYYKWINSVNKISTDNDLWNKLIAIKKEYLVEKLNSNACYYFYKDDEITKLISKIKLNEIKNPILPRFSKVYHYLLKKKNIEYKDLDPSFANASSCILGLVYAHNFSKYIADNFNMPDYKVRIKSYIKKYIDTKYIDVKDKKHINKKYNDYNLDNCATLDEYKRNMMSMCLGDEDKVRKAEKKFVEFVSVLFNEYLKSNPEFDILNNIVAEPKTDNPYIELKGYNPSNYIKPKNLSLFAKLIISTMPFLRKGVLAKFKGDLLKYRQAIIAIKDIENYKSKFKDYENKFDYLSPSDADSIINLMEFQIEAKEKKYLQNFETENNDGDKKSLFNEAFTVFNYDGQFKKYQDITYNPMLYDNKHELKKTPVGLFTAQPKEKSYKKDDQYIPFKFILELSEYEHLDKLIKLHKEVMGLLKIDMKTILEEYGDYKSHIDINSTFIANLINESLIEESLLEDGLLKGSLIKDDTTLTLIELYNKLRDEYFLRLKNAIYTEKDKGTGTQTISKKMKDQSNKDKIILQDPEKFIEDLKIYSELNKRILRYTFISNLLHLNIVNKSFAIYSELNSRILSWEYDLYPLNKDLIKCKYDNDFDAYKENNDVLNQIYEIYGSKIPRQQYKKIFNNARHYSLLRNCNEKSLSNYKNLSSFFIGGSSLENHLSFLTNFRNDVENVFSSILKKYNLIYNNKNNKNKNYLSPRSHNFLNKEYILSKIDLRDDAEIEDIKLISNDEVKYLNAFIFKADFTKNTTAN